MNIKVDFDNIVVKEDKNDFNVKVLMLKGEKGDQGDGEPNVIEKVQVNGTNLPVNNKTVNVPVPTVDSSLSSSSTNPVQNNTIYTALSNKVDTSELNNYYEISEVDALLTKKPYCFENVSAMKSNNLNAGDYAITNGYYENGDGGSAIYIIKSNTDAFSETLNNGLKAELIINGNMNIKCFGVYGDGTHDDTNKFQTAINIMSSKKGELILIGGTYLISNTINLNQNSILNIKNKVTINSNYDGVLFLYEENDNTSNINIIKGDGILYLHSNLGISSNSVGLQIGSSTSQNINDICFSNLTFNNFNIGCNLINKNVWNITFQKCTFHFNSIGVKYGGLTQSNAGERIAFNTCLFTQNKLDVTIQSTLWSQMNFTNCSFDYSDCMFYVDWKDPNYTSNRYKISLNQCHIEGIASNLDEIPNDRPIGILYADALYGIIFSIIDSVIILSKSYYWFKVVNNTHNFVSRIILKDIQIFGSSNTIKHIPSLSNTEVSYENIYWVPEIGNINGSYLRRFPSVPISDKVLINDDPYFKNEPTDEYTPANNMVIGDYKLRYVTGVKKLSVVDNNEFVSGGKKIVLTMDTDYSGAYTTSLNLENTKKFKIEPNKRIVYQIYTDLIQTQNNNHKTTSITGTYYDRDDNQVGQSYLYCYTGSPSDEEIGLIETQPSMTPANADYVKFIITVRNGNAGEIVETRTIKGFYIYYLD